MTLDGSWRDYPHLYRLEHKECADLLSRELVAEEKVDGSQFSFGAFTSETGERVLRVRSHKQEFDPATPNDMFVAATATARDLFERDLLTVGYAYRAEALKGRGHNVLKYGREPRGGLVLFDVNVGDGRYMSYDEKAAEAARLGLEITPALARGVLTLAEVEALWETDALLGGVKIEGVVLKPVETNYSPYGGAIIGKHVRPSFKEAHKKAWGEGSQQDGHKTVIERLAARYSTVGRYNKAFQHLGEDGELVYEMRDIPALVAEVKRDLLAEEGDDIARALFEAFSNEIARGVARGVPAYYADKLRERLEESQPA